MYAIGDKVVYGALGVMEIVDIADQTVADVTRKYYVMREFASPTNSLTYVPIENEMLVSQIKPLLTRDEIYETVRAAKASPLIDFVEENRARSEMYKGILASGDRVKILSMIQTVYITGVRREREGKRNFMADENIMKRAEKNVAIEFSLVLGIAEDGLNEFIMGVN